MVHFRELFSAEFVEGSGFGVFAPATPFFEDQIDGGRFGSSTQKASRSAICWRSAGRISAKRFHRAERLIMRAASI
jgi:hypothetical protein